VPRIWRELRTLVQRLIRTQSALRRLPLTGKQSHEFAVSQLGGRTEHCGFLRRARICAEREYAHISTASVIRVHGALLRLKARCHSGIGPFCLRLITAFAACGKDGKSAWSGTRRSSVRIRPRRLGHTGVVILTHMTFRLQKQTQGGLFVGIEKKTLEPDGTAIACKAILSGFDSHRRLFQAWSVGSVRPAARGVPDSHSSWHRGFASRVPDMVSKWSRPIPVSSVGRAPD
jgi:hypothetical protein